MLLKVTHPLNLSLCLKENNLRKEFLLKISKQQENEEMKILIIFLNMANYRSQGNLH